MSYDPLAMYSPPRPGMEDTRPAGQVAYPSSSKVSPKTGNSISATEPFAYGTVLFDDALTPSQLVQFLGHLGYSCSGWLAMSTAQRDALVRSWVGGGLAHDATNDGFMRWVSRNYYGAIAPRLTPNEVLTLRSRTGQPPPTQQELAEINTVDPRSGYSQIDALRRIREALDNACAASKYNQLYGAQPASTNITAKAPATASTFSTMHPFPSGQVAAPSTAMTYGGYLLAAVAGGVAGYMLRGKRR